jgi:S1-C subfamily serine protease
MRHCSRCQQLLSEGLSVCPVCGNALQPGRTSLDEYLVDSFISEWPDSWSYKAHRAGGSQPLFIRLFKPQAGLTEETAQRLRAELEILRSLPPGRFVRHMELRQSADGLWYRVSEWLDAVNWGDLIASGYFLNHAQAARLLATVAEDMDAIHQLGCAIPHLTLDDLLPVRGPDGDVSVWIDYKLSRFINPNLPNPRPELAALLAVHPDIQSGRPLDFRSDTWSMGRLFAKLLTGEDHPPAALEALQASAAPPRLKALLRQMLDDDANARPASALVVAQTLRQAASDDAARIRAEQASARFARRPGLALALLALLAVAGAAVLFLQLRYGAFSRDSSTRLSRYAERYRGAVAYVAVAYALVADGHQVAGGLSEGSAFLVDQKGYLLTNRHVACPWLEDAKVAETVEAVPNHDRQLRLDYRILVWFDGQKALRRGPPANAPAGIDDYLEDKYFVENAYRSNGSPAVRIAGILPPPHTLRERLLSPLGDDVAFLKIDRVPAGVLPIPMPGPQELKPKALEPVLVLGFPLGSDQNMAPELVASATIGNVRRSFENVHQVSASIHPGNSGGPVVDADGRLLGIASALAKDNSPGEPSERGLSDFGMVLPVEKALPLLAALERGEPKWDGVPYYDLSRLGVQVAKKAERGQWSEAMQLVAGEAAGNRDPKLLELMALVQYGSGGKEATRRSLDRAKSEMPGDALAALLRFAVEWRDAPELELKDPTTLDAPWYSPWSFNRYCYRVMRGEIDEQSALQGWEDASEKAMLLWTVAMRRLHAGKPEDAARLLRLAADEAGLDTSERLLALADYTSLAGTEGWAPDAHATPKSGELERLLRTWMAPLLSYKEPGQQSDKAQIGALARLVEADPDDSYVLTALAYRLAGLGEWSLTSNLLDLFARRAHRHSAVSMSAWLLRAEVLAAQGQADAARSQLQDIASRADWPWYPEIARDLLGQTPASSSQPARHPPEILTLGAARGLWAEAANDPKAAVQYYRSALDSYLSSWSEYRFAATRLARMRTQAQPKP